MGEWLRKLEQLTERGEPIDYETAIKGLNVIMEQTDCEEAIFQWANRLYGELLWLQSAGKQDYAN